MSLLDQLSENNCINQETMIDAIKNLQNHINSIEKYSSNFNIRFLEGLMLFAKLDTIKNAEAFVLRFINNQSTQEEIEIMNRYHNKIIEIQQSVDNIVV